METLSRTQARSWQGLRKELVSSSHTLPCYLSMPRSRVEAGKKQPRRSLEYGYSKERCSFSPPLVFLYPSFGLLMKSSEMVRSEFGEASKWYTTGNVCSSVNETGFMGLRTYVQKPMKLCSLRNNNKMQDTTITY